MRCGNAISLSPRAADTIAPSLVSRTEEATASPWLCYDGAHAPSHSHCPQPGPSPARSFFPLLQSQTNCTMPHAHPTSPPSYLVRPSLPNRGSCSLPAPPRHCQGSFTPYQNQSPFWSQIKLGVNLGWLGLPGYVTSSKLRNLPAAVFPVKWK